MRSSGLLVLLLGAAFLAGCGGETVATVAGEGIPEEKLDALLEKIEREYAEAGREVPKRGTPSYERLRTSALRLLVFRAELAQRAASLGISVGDDEVKRRLGTSAAESEEQEGEAVEREREDAVRAQLLYEKVFFNVTRDVRVTEAEARA